MKYPVDKPYRITGKYGQTGGAYPASGHSGTDFVSDNKRVYAPHSGTVYAGKDSRNGNYLVIDNGTYRSTLSHFARRSVAGGTVKEGQYLGIMGKSGLATGVHLHWTLRKNGVRVDPEKHLPKGGNMYKGKTAREWYVKYAKRGNHIKMLERRLKSTQKEERREENLRQEHAALLVEQSEQIQSLRDVHSQSKNDLAKKVEELQKKNQELMRAEIELQKCEADLFEQRSEFRTPPINEQIRNVWNHVANKVKEIFNVR